MEKRGIKGTSNQILVKIASGINYASDLAKNTGKSIPVMFRQLDELMQKGILTKERSGKKVEYKINWKTISKDFADFIKDEFNLSKDVVSKLKLDLPDVKELQEIFESSFSTDYLQEILKEMYKDIESVGNISYDYAKITFNESINLLMELFGTTDKEKEIMKKIPAKNKEAFKKFIKTSKAYVKMKKEIDPKNKLKEKL
jgi:DNA-binding transcriptional ArsR family regulator